MKKLIVPIVALATVFVFTSCGKEDTTPPEITLPTDALLIDLGGEKAALEGVTAKDDKDGDVTNSLKVSGLDFVGEGTLTYSAKDKSDNVGTKTRPVTIRAQKLAGKYVVDESGPSYFTGQDTIMTYSVDVVEDRNVPTEITIDGLFSYTINFIGDGKSMTLKMQDPFNVDLGGGVIMTLKGSATYTKSGEKYSLSTCTFTATYSNSSKDETYNVVFR
jgi:hypothetical protein